MCLLTCSLLRRTFLRVFNNSAFAFLLIFCGLGHHFGSCLASPSPLGVPLLLCSTTFGLSYGCPATPRASEKCVILGLANLCKTCAGVYGSHIARHPKLHRHKADIETFPNNLEQTLRARPESARGHPQGCPGHPNEPQRRSRAQNTTQNEHSGALAVPN